MSRRLPVYLLLDTSGSMSGEPIQQVNNGVQMLAAALRQDPQALESAHLSVITFSSDAAVAVPLTELTAFQPPTLTAGGGTSLGEGLAKVAERASTELTKTTATTKGDWKPMVFIMTDGSPTDDWQKGLAEFKKQKWGPVIACCVDNGDESVLKQITENVVKISTQDAEAMKKLFKWVSASIAVSSKAVDQGGKEPQGLDQLPPPPPEIPVVT